MSQLREWLFPPLPPWQFWRPQSGFPGGMVAGLVTILLIILGYLLGSAIVAALR